MLVEGTYSREVHIVNLTNNLHVIPVDHVVTQDEVDELVGQYQAEHPHFFPVKSVELIERTITKTKFVV